MVMSRDGHTPSPHSSDNIHEVSVPNMVIYPESDIPNTIRWVGGTVFIPNTVICPVLDILDMVMWGYVVYIWHCLVNVYSSYSVSLYKDH